MKHAMPFVVLLLSLSLSAFSQQTPQEQKKNAIHNLPEIKAPEGKTGSAKEKKKPIAPSDIPATTHIQNLKNGVLLVRLRTSETSIENLKNAGNEQMAATLQRRQDAENQRLIAAFQQHFSFCPVYFFYSNVSIKIKNGDFKGAFVNENLKPASDPEITERNFYVAEMTDLDQFRPDPDAPDAGVNAEVTFRALVIRDNNFHQLNKPFPFYIKASQNIPPRKRSEPEMVILLNDKLTAFYKSSVKAAK